MTKGVEIIACHTFTKEINFKQCQNYRTISVISHRGRLMLQIIFSQLKAKAEELLAEEQAGFRLSWST